MQKARECTEDMSRFAEVEIKFVSAFSQRAFLCDFYDLSSPYL
jgi:hypothetical protein